MSRTTDEILEAEEEREQFIVAAEKAYEILVALEGAGIDFPKALMYSDGSGSIIVDSEDKEQAEALLGEAPFSWRRSFEGGVEFDLGSAALVQPCSACGCHCACVKP